MIAVIKTVGVKIGLALGAVGVAVMAEYVFLNVLTLHLQWETLLYASTLLAMILGMWYAIKYLVPPTTPLSVE